MLLGAYLSVQAYPSPASWNNDALFLAVQLSQGGESIVCRAELDTGSDSLIVPPRVARDLHLPDVSTTYISGFGGTERDYTSTIDITIDGHLYSNIPCVVSAHTPIVVLGIDAMRKMGVRSIYMNLATKRVALGFGGGAPAN